MGHQERHDGQQPKAPCCSGQFAEAADIYRSASSRTWRPQLRGSATRQGGLPG